MMRGALSFLREAVKDTFAALPEKVRDALLSAALPVVSILFAPLGAWAQREAQERPWGTLWVALPAAVVLWLLLRSPAGKRGFRPKGRPLVLLMVYSPLVLAVFFARLADRRPEYVGPYIEELRERRSPRFGDWRYWCAPRPPRDPRMTIVTIPPDSSRMGRRKELAGLLNLATASGASGVIIDGYMLEADTTSVDSRLAAEIFEARAAGLTVLAGMPMQQANGGGFLRWSVPRGLADALPDTCLGHLFLFRESDGRVRSLPLHLEGHPGRPALAALAASRMGALNSERIELPSQDLLRFLPPSREFRVIRSDDLKQPGTPLRGYLRGQYLLVGEESSAESLETVVGGRLGVELQAWAINSLLTGRFIHRAQWWLSLFATWAALYWLATLASQGVTRRALLTWWLALSIGAALFAAAAMLAGLYWVDLAYVLPAITLFAAVLIALQGAHRGRRRAVHAGGAP